MPKFQVHFKRMVDETLSVIVEASNEQEARDRASNIARYSENVRWTPGDYEGERAVLETIQVGDEESERIEFHPLMIEREHSYEALAILRRIAATPDVAQFAKLRLEARKFVAQVDADLPVLKTGDEAVLKTGDEPDGTGPCP